MNCTTHFVRVEGVFTVHPASTPVALFTIGTVLWRAGQHVHGRTPIMHFLPIVISKLAVHPLLVFAVGWIAIRAFGVALTPFNLTVLVLAAALPSATTVSLLAERYGADNGRVTRAVVASTVGAFATFSALAWMLGARAH